MHHISSLVNIPVWVRLTLYLSFHRFSIMLVQCVLRWICDQCTIYILIIFVVRSEMIGNIVHRAKGILDIFSPDCLMIEWVYNIVLVWI